MLLNLANSYAMNSSIAKISNNLTKRYFLQRIYYQRLESALISFNPLSANPTKWSNTLRQFAGC